MKHFLLLILIIGLSFYVFSQSYNDSIPKIDLSTIINVNQGNSYITFPTDVGNIEPLWFEGNVIPNFFIRESKNAKLMGVITSQIIIRMYQEESFPVRTPSYMPQISVYYLLNSDKKVNSLSLFGKLAHHSNGQDGDFYQINNEINLKTGNFSTNFYEFGVIKTNYNPRFNAIQFVGTSFEVHPESVTMDELIGKYSLYRLNLIFSIFKIPPLQYSIRVRKADISIKGETTWMLGKFNDLNPFSYDRVNLRLSFYYHPKFFEDIGFFAQLYHGMDYYNIYFDHQINILRFGLMTEKLRF